MSINREALKDRFEGCLLGLAIGDALGGKFEAQSADAIRARFPTSESLIAYPQDEIWYTDDTQMAIGVAEALIEQGEIVEESLCRAFVANYVASRGYGRGARAVLDAMEESRDYRAVSEQYFPGGSFGNGAAMRVAPVGLVFGSDRARLWDQARLSALPTHRHPLGIACSTAACQAGICSRGSIRRAAFSLALLSSCESNEYRRRLKRRRGSVSMTFARQSDWRRCTQRPLPSRSFVSDFESFESTICNVIFRGDTDTLAAMAGRLSGAYLGLRAPAELAGGDLLERSPKGRDYLRALAGRLLEVHDRLTTAN
ncbi:MAG: ADP-ribosylglycohydrolase family protein [Gemmataceae bacterium]